MIRLGFALAFFLSMGEGTVAQQLDHMLQYHADADEDKWMQSLKRPDSPEGYSCCNKRDCAKTDAEWKTGQWWAEFKGVMVPVPPEKELDVLSFDGNALLCAAPDSPVAKPLIYCFVKPGMGF